MFSLPVDFVLLPGILALIDQENNNGLVARHVHCSGVSGMSDRLQAKVAPA
jgi:hypothetical protein